MGLGTYHVLLGSRSSSKGEAAVKDLESRKLPGTVELVTIDTSKDDTINAAAENVEKKHGKLDVLVNNAAVAIVEGSLREQMNTAFDVNATGALVISQAFLPLLKKSSSNPRIVMVSSGAGSIDLRINSEKSMTRKMFMPWYRASKAAMNMIAMDLGVMNEDDKIKVFTYCPGFTASNLSDFNTTENGAKPTSEGTTPLVDIIEGKRDAEEKKFLMIGGTYNW